MPSSSKKQHNFMEAVAHSPAFAKKVGVPQSVGKDFSNADKGRKFSKGGDTMATAKKVAPSPMGKPVMKPGMSTAKDGMKKPTPMAKTSMAGSMMGMKKGGATKKMASGGMAASSMGKVRTAAPSRDGVADKGKTRGTQVKMAGSGVPGGIGSRVMKKGGMAKC
jgi:hypothetical protein